jgi:hypothetical protein
MVQGFDQQGRIFCAEMHFGLVPIFETNG